MRPNKNLPTMTFRDHCHSKCAKPPRTKSERMIFIETIARLCDVTTQNVYAWLNGLYEPSDENKYKIASYLKTDPLVLFPKRKDDE